METVYAHETLVPSTRLHDVIDVHSINLHRYTNLLVYLARTSSQYNLTRGTNCPTKLCISVKFYSRFLMDIPACPQFGLNYQSPQWGGTLESTGDSHGNPNHHKAANGISDGHSGTSAYNA
jgi:hypothetical protein